MIYTIGVYKGGTGKTTTAAALSHYLAKETLKTLVIDLNAQGSLSLIMRATGRNGTIADAIRGRSCKPEKLTGKLYILPAGPELEEIRDEVAITEAIKEAAESFYNVVIDSPPENKTFLNAALLASDYVIMPLNADIYGAQGFLQMVATVKKARGKNLRLKFGGVFLNEYNQRATIARTMRETIQQAAAGEGVPYLGEVRRGVAIEEAAALRESIFDHAPRSNPAKDLQAVFEKVLHLDYKL